MSEVLTLTNGCLLNRLEHCVQKSSLSELVFVKIILCPDIYQASKKIDKLVVIMFKARGDTDNGIYNKNYYVNNYSFALKYSISIV